MSELPKGWAEGTIEDVLGILPSGKQLDQGWSPRCENFPSASEETWGALKTTAIQDGWFEAEHTKQLPDHLDPKPELEVKPGDVLLTCAGPRVRCGVICRVDDVRRKLFISGKMYRFRPDERIVEPDYLMALLRSPDQKKAIDQIKTGGSESGLNLTQARFKALKVPFPPMPEQRRIVSKLDTLSTRTTAARTHLTAIANLVERYKQAVLLSAFRGTLSGQYKQECLRGAASNSIRRLLQLDLEARFEAEMAEWRDDFSAWEDSLKTEKRPAKPRKVKPPLPISEAQRSRMWALPQSWDWVQIGSMAFVTKLAGFEYTSFVTYDDEGDLSVLKAENAGTNGFKATNYSRVASSTVEHLKRSQIFGGEVLVVFVGAGVGNVAAVPSDTRFFLGPNVGMVRPYGKHLNSKYLEYFLRSEQGKSLLLSEAKAVAQPSISMGAIRNTPVPMCHPDEQRETVRRIETAFAKIDRLAAEAEKALKLTDRLDQRILAKAFAGELVPQDPTDEPATELLARIREARAAAPKSKRGRRKKVAT